MHADVLDTPASSPANPIPLAIAPLLLDESQAAALLSLSPRKLWELAARGAIKSVKIGALKRYRRIDLEAWVASGCPTE
jgi:excisionase family DNA binding protein